MAANLTPKQESFVLAYLETGNASEAYRRFYSVANMKPQTVNRKGKMLVDMDKIRARIEELCAPIPEKACITLEQHLEELLRVRDAAKDLGHMSAAIKAEECREPHS
jgi:phage terminase small subunit